MCTSGQDFGQAVDTGQVGVLDAACTSVIAVATHPVPVARSILPSPPCLLPWHAFVVAIVDASADAGCALQGIEPGRLDHPKRLQLIWLVLWQYQWLLPPRTSFPASSCSAEMD